MPSLTSCMKKAGDLLRPEDRAAILARAAVLRAGGAKNKDASAQAVDERIAEVRSLLEAAAPPKADDTKPKKPQNRVEEPGAPYETDLFGERIDLFGGVPGDARRAAPVGRPAARGDVQPASAVPSAAPGDTPAPTGEYGVRTVVGQVAERELGAARIRTAADAAAATNYLYRNAVERFDGIVVDKAGKPLAVVGGFKGKVNAADIYFGTLIGEIVRVPGAAGVWFSHNHPSGVSALSLADRRLYEALADAMRGSGIEAKGLLAIGDGTYMARTEGANETGGPIPKSTATSKVPVIERELVPSKDALPFISSTTKAKDAAAAYYGQAKKPGLMLLDTQQFVVAWVPLPPAAMGGPLRGTGGLNAIYRAVSESNAASAIIVHGGELDRAAVPRSPFTLGQNIGKALSNLDVRVLDMVDGKTGKSAAEGGALLSAGPLFSRSEQDQVAESSQQAARLIGAYRAAYGKTPSGMSREEFRRFIDDRRAAADQLDAEILALARRADGLLLQSRSGSSMVALHADPRTPGAWRTTTFTLEMEPSGHMEFGKPIEAATEFRNMAAGADGAGIAFSRRKVTPEERAAMGDMFAQPGAQERPERPSGDTDASLARSRPRQMVVFAKPYAGKTGAKLVGYEWKWRPESIVDKRGEDRTVRISDWEQAFTNPETNRDIVHQFQVERAGGGLDIVSAETAAKMLGVSQSTVRSSAKRLLDEHMRAQRDAERAVATADAIDAAQAWPTPAAAIENHDGDGPGYAAIVARRALAEGKEWGAPKGGYDRGLLAGRTYRFIVRDGRYLFSPELVSPDSELHRRGWRTVDLRADAIWTATGADKMAAERPLLAAQTEADLRAKTEREARAAADDAAEQRRLADKERADAMRDEFVLTGSDRPADVAAAAGQGALFSRRTTPEQRAANFAAWGNNAPVVRSQDAMAHDFKSGEAVVVEAFHGTARPDRVGAEFKPSRATSGPMAFFTADPVLASSYAQGKADTSLAYEDQSYEQWFKFKVVGERSAVDIVRAWYRLPEETKKRIEALAPRVTFDMRGDGIVLGPEDHNSGTGSYDYNLEATRRGFDKRGNPLKAMVEDWLNSGNLIGNEEQFLRVLKLAGFPVEQVEFDNPQATYPAVIHGHIAFRKPLVTGDVPEEVRAALDQAARRDRTKPAGGGADMWDKNTRSVREWVAAFNDEVAGLDSSYVWTSIPDKVTDVFRSLGYDGIIDVGGKGGGARHRVYIPFGPTQFKGAFNKGTYDPQKRGFLASRGDEPGGAPAARGAWAPTEDQLEKVQSLNSALVSYGLGENWRNAYAPAPVPDALPGFREAVQAAVRRDVQFVAPTAAGFNLFNGVVIEEAPGTVFVNAQSKQGLVQVALHELWHDLRRTRPDLYRWFRTTAQPYWRNTEVFREKLNRLLQPGEPAYSEGQALEELEANFLGDSFADRKFLQALADDSPSKFKQLVNIVLDWLERVAAALRPGFGSDAYVTDVQAMQEHLRKVLVAFAEGKPIPAGPKPSAPVFTRDAPAAPFYSALARGVDGLKSAAAPAAGWRDAIRGLVAKGAVKQDEVEWTGVNEWLGLQQGKVTKADVLAYLRDNGVRVEEVTLGQTEDAASALNRALEGTGYSVEADNIDEEIVYLDPDGELVDYVDLPKKVQRIVDEQAGKVQGATKYGQYTLPGGTNYREVLLTLPAKKPAPLTALPEGFEVSINRWLRPEDGIYTVIPPGQMDGRPYAGVHKTEEAAKAAALAALNRVRQREAEGGGYKSRHWDQPNVLAHIRLNDRTDADGKRVLFVEEVQSDWGQEGKKRGFKASDAEAAAIKAEYDAAAQAVSDALNDGGDVQAARERMAAATDAYNARINDATIPRAPFVDKTDKWLGLAMKRIAVMAAQEGYDRVAFVTGEQSVQRYDLSKHIEQIRYTKSRDGSTASVEAYKDGRNVFNQANMSMDKVADTFGKEIAEKIERGESSSNDPYSGYSVLSGIDLKVGGEGMRAFYDKIVPAAAKDVLKKLGGGSLGQVRISAKDNRFGLERDFDPATVRVQESLGAFTVMDARGSIRTFDSRKAAQDYIDGGAARTQPGFDITPAMREKAAAGLPLFQRVWHGTPHRGIERFSTDAIGTGEGAQAYGWGLYFASRREVAEHYRKTLTERAAPDLWTDELRAQLPQPLTTAQRDEFNALGQKMLRNGSLPTSEMEQWRKLKDIDTGYHDAVKRLEPKGQLYEVEIPGDGEMLLWDKPLSEQPERVRAAVSDLLVVAKNEDPAYGDEKWLLGFGNPNNDLSINAYSTKREAEAARTGMTGREFYQALTPAKGPRGASMFLAQRGIRGIKYLDGVSRNKPLREVKREFLAELPEDASFDEVTELLGTGKFSAKNEAVLRALAADDWLGFDYPAQALSAALGGRLDSYDASPALVQAVADTQDDSTYNYVIFDGADAEIQRVHFSRATVAQGRIRRTLDELVQMAEEQASWKDWYSRHQAVVERLFGADAELFQKILSATSQLQTVKGNVTMALRAYERMVSGQPFQPGFLPAVAKNLERIRNDEALKGPKISEFERGNLGSDEAIAVDRHIAQLLFNTSAPNRAQVESAKQRIRAVAQQLGWTYREAQAALWAANQVRLGTDPSQVVSYDRILEDRADLIEAIHARNAAGGGRRVPFGRAADARAQEAGRAEAAGEEVGRPRPRFSRADPTDTEAFRRWFGDSKVVDAQGNPLVVYHGTHRDFSAFDAKAPPSHIPLPGFYFTPDPAIGSMFAENGAKVAENRAGRPYAPIGANVMPVYLSLKNPLDVDVSEGAMGKFVGEKVIKEVILEAQRRGHDGVILRGWADGSGPVQYIAFKPEQIKSATGNRGTFDPENPSILFSRSEPAETTTTTQTASGSMTTTVRRSAWLDPTNRIQFAPGQWLYNAIGRAANPLLTKLQLKAASPEMRRLLRQMKLDVAKAQETASTVAKDMLALDQGEREMVSDIIEKELAAGIAPPEHAVRLAAVMNQAMGAQSRELVRLGMLSEEAAQRWDGAYLPRFYESKLRPKVDAWADAVRKLIGRTPVMQGIKGKHLKGRGLYETIPVRELDKWQRMGWEVRDPDYDPDPAQRSMLPPDGTVQVWRDFTREEREKMGEIRDAGFRFVMGYTQTQRDIAIGKMFETIANDERLSSRTQREGWARVPDGTVEGTGAKKYGKLAGRFVPMEVLSQLSALDEAQSAAWQFYRKAMGYWKMGKTAMNPVSHMNNIVSNLSMAHFAGVSYHRADKYIGALRDFVIKPPMMQEAKDAGLFLGTMGAEELVQDLPKELQELVAKGESQVLRGAKLTYDIMTFFLRKPLGKAYEAEDLFFRYLIYKDARQRGMEPQDAVDHAQRFIFTYDDLPKGARMIRDFGIPFFAYTYKAIPALLHTALTHPHRMIAPAAVLWGVNAIAYAIATDDDDDWQEAIKKYVEDPAFRERMREKQESERENLPPWMKGMTALATPKAIRLGMDEVTELPLFIDVARIIPGGDIFDVSPNAGGIPLPQPITPSHPLFSISVAMLANKDLWTGKDLVTKGADTSAEAAQKRAGWMWKQLSPAVAVGNYHWERTLNALAQATGSEVRVTWPLPDDIEARIPEAVAKTYTGIGRDGMPVQPGYAAMQTFGIKVRPIDLDLAEKIDQSNRQRLIRDIDNQLRTLRRLNAKGSVTDRALDEAIETAQQKKDRLREGLTVDGNKRD